MYESKPIENPAEDSALFVADTIASGTSNSQHRTEEKPRIWCDFWKKPRHTLESCWKIHGKPANWKSSKPEDRFARAQETYPFSK